VIFARSGDYGQKSYWCGKQLVITGNGKTTTATVVDACPGCGGAAGLDMTPALFAYFISPDAGVSELEICILITTNVDMIS